MKSDVFFADFEADGPPSLDKLDALLVRTDLKRKIKERDLVAIKMHFGEKGNTAFVPPIFVGRVVDRVKRYKGKPFLTDTNTLYRGMRQEAVSHLTNAYEHGFVYSSVGAPILIADGLKGNSTSRVKIGKAIFETVSVAHDIYMADVLIGITHFTGHELTGFAGTLKNLGMGCASREGKLRQHSNISPQVKKRTCKGCEQCLTTCAQEAISMKPPLKAIEGKPLIAFIDPGKCIGCGECILTCPSGAIQIRWNETIPIFQKKMVEHAYGAVQKKRGKALYLSFLTQISPTCDCHGYSATPMVDDIGILCSGDPVAIDQASVDLVNRQEGNRSSKLPGGWNRGEDKFRALYPEADWSIQLHYAEEIGLGTREYELIRI